MDKKNTMLLTVIAVATLLVAVVGATFAFFAISTDQGKNSKTNITGTTPNVPSSAIALTGAQDLKLHLTADNMAQAKQGHYFYATSTDNAAEEETSKPTDHKVTIGTATLQGGESGTTYKCTASYRVTVLKDAATGVQEGNISDVEFTDEDAAVLFLYGGDGSVDVTGLDSGVGLKLSEIIEAGETGKTGDIIFNLTGGSSDSKTLQAALQIKNATTPRQDALANKTFVVNLEATSFTCDAVESE